MGMIESKNRATSDPEARKRVLERDREAGGRMTLLLWFTDLEGHLKSFAVTPSEIEGALNDGMGFDGSSITGFNAIEESDMVAIPDPDHVPACRRDGSRAMICDVVTPDGSRTRATHGTFSGWRSSGWRPSASTRSTSGPELEYFLFEYETLRPSRSTRAATSR